MPNLMRRQTRMVEVGRIRIGEKSEKNAPRARNTFRFTSQNRDLLETLAAQHGGTVQPWAGNPGQYELCSEAAALPVLISLAPTPDGNHVSISQDWERWAGSSNCTHRCDGVNCQIWQGSDRVTVPCECEHPPHGKPICKLVTRVKVLLPSVPTLGLWRLETRSSIFDQEIHGLIENLSALGVDGVQAMTMRIVFREKRTAPGQPTSKFPVVVFELDQNPKSLPELISKIRAQALSVGDTVASCESMAELPVGAPALESPKEESEETQLREFVQRILGDSASDFYSWCEGENCDWMVIARAAVKAGVNEPEKFWQGAQKVRDRGNS